MKYYNSAFDFLFHSYFKRRHFDNVSRMNYPETFQEGY